MKKDIIAKMIAEAKYATDLDDAFSWLVYDDFLDRISINSNKLSKRKEK